MNISCIICTDSFISSSSIASAGSCGHCFHTNCLQRWLSTSRTCPQCRRSCIQSNRIYLNISEEGNTSNSSNANSLKQQLRNKDRKVKNLEAEIKKKANDLLLLNTRMRDNDAKLTSLQAEVDRNSLYSSQIKDAKIQSLNTELTKRKDENYKLMTDHKREIQFKNYTIKCLETELNNKKEECNSLMLREKDAKIKVLEAEIEKEKEISKCVKTVASLEKSLKSKEELLSDKQKKLDWFNIGYTSMREKIVQLEQKIENLSAIEEVLTATPSEVEDIIKNENDPKVLGSLIAHLKKELKRSAMSMESLKLAHKDHHRELEAENKELKQKVEKMKTTEDFWENRAAQICFCEKGNFLP